MKMIFTRQNAHGKSRVGFKYRRAKGLQSKMRLNKRGYLKKPTTGYGNARSSRDDIVIISSASQLEGLSPATKACVSASVGLKKQKELLDAAEKVGIKLLNLSTDTLAARNKKILAKKQARLEKQKLKKESGKKSEEKKKEKESSEDLKKTKPETDEERKKEEKKEKDKILVTKSA
ncbi:hypothetical protein JW868_04955 [Candidatus Woesearchaeota archaeon]|nr:hypothetical protein [Candidatus Woesearchaeota archaeon]